jgi:phosphatidyl-myo-inositol dimannoside synthase
MNVLVLLTDAYGGRGGIAKFNRDLIAAISTSPHVSGVDVLPRVVADEPTGIPQGVRFRASAAGSKLQYVWAILLHVLGGPRPALIVCGHIYLSPFARLLSRWYGVQWVMILHGIEAWEPPPLGVQRSSLSGMTRAFAVSEYSRRRFLEWAHVESQQVSVIPNCVEVSAYSPGPKADYLLDRYDLRGKRVLLTLGRLVSKERAKGFDEVIKALSELESDVVYLIVGDGPDRGRLEALSAEHGVADRVRFAGYIDEIEKCDHYRTADLFVMPSRGEGFGIVFLEAMASGLPVVASTADGGFEAVRQGKLGRVVDPDDSEMLLHAIREALNDEASPREELAYFSFQAFEKRWHQALDDLVHKRAPDSSGPFADDSTAAALSPI